MPTLIIHPDKESDLALIKSLCERMQIPFTLSEPSGLSEEAEEQALGQLIEASKEELLDPEEKKNFFKEIGLK